MNNKVQDVRIKLGNLLLIKRANEVKYEIVAYNSDSTVYTLAFIIDSSSDGFDLRTVGKRPFEHDNFWSFAKFCLNTLTELHFIEDVVEEED